MKIGIPLITLATALSSASALADDSALVRFSGGIGVDPVAAVANGAQTPNTVRGVPPGGRAWVIDQLKVTVKRDGSISGRGTGLIFSAGDNIGTRGGVAKVFATLVCGDPGKPNELMDLNSAAVDLDLAGDFKLSGMLSAVPPEPCVAPVLLIRGTNGAQPWFAAGIPRVGGKDD